MQTVHLLLKDLADIHQRPGGFPVFIYTVSHLLNCEYYKIKKEVLLWTAISVTAATHV